MSRAHASLPALTRCWANAVMFDKILLDFGCWCQYWATTGPMLASQCRNCQNIARLAYIGPMLVCYLGSFFGCPRRPKAAIRREERQCQPKAVRRWLSQITLGNGRRNFAHACRRPKFTHPGCCCWDCKTVRLFLRCSTSSGLLLLLLFSGMLFFVVKWSLKDIALGYALYAETTERYSQVNHKGPLGLC